MKCGLNADYFISLVRMWTKSAIGTFTEAVRSILSPYIMHRAEASALINAKLETSEHYYEVYGGIKATFDTPR